MVESVMDTISCVMSANLTLSQDVRDLVSSTQIFCRKFA